MLATDDRDAFVSTLYVPGNTRNGGQKNTHAIDSFRLAYGKMRSLSGFRRSISLHSTPDRNTNEAPCWPVHMRSVCSLNAIWSSGRLILTQERAWLGNPCSSYVGPLACINSPTESQMEMRIVLRRPYSSRLERWFRSPFPRSKPISRQFDALATAPWFLAARLPPHHQTSCRRTRDGLGAAAAGRACQTAADTRTTSLADRFLDS